MLNMDELNYSVWDAMDDEERHEQASLLNIPGILMGSVSVLLCTT